MRLDSVISDITGTTGQRIPPAIIGVGRDPHRLAALRDKRIRAGADRIAAALGGTWRGEHMFALEQAMQRLHFPTEQTGECGARIAERIDALTPPDGNGGDTPRKAPLQSAAAADREMARALRGMMGVDLTAPNIAPEIGPDLSAFPSARHFCSWLGLAPGTRFGGGRTLPGRAPKVVNRAAQALRMAAVSARKSRTSSAPGTARASPAGTGLKGDRGHCHQQRARLARRDGPVAVNATARGPAVSGCTMVTRGEECVERGMAAWEERRARRAVSSLERRARQLGHRLARPDESPDPVKSAA